MTRNLWSNAILWALCTLLLLCCFAIVASAQNSDKRPAHIGLVFPLSTNGTDAATFSNGGSFHVLAGLSRNEEAFCLAGLSSVVKENADGVMISGLVNHIGNEATGFQLAGLVNHIGGTAKGLQISGLVNVAGQTKGVQLAGLSNITQEVAGVQMAGLLNTAKNAAVQLAGWGNITQNGSATQVAGFINLAKEVHAQVSGFMNIASKVEGVQIAGFINIAEESDYPIGLINIIKNGSRQIGISVDDGGASVLAFRSGGRTLYGILGAGYNFHNPAGRYVLEGGMGVHMPLTRWLGINGEAVFNTLSDIKESVYFKSSLRTLATVKVAKRFELFAGPTFNHLGFNDHQSDIGPKHYLWTYNPYSYFQGVYLGLMGGLQVNL